MTGMPDFTEVAPRVWVAHYDWMHVNITLIGGADGLVMVDTHGSEHAGPRSSPTTSAASAPAPLTALVNTHDHWDHWFGNDVFLAEYGDLPVHATEFALEQMVAAGGRSRRRTSPTTRGPTRSSTPRCARRRTASPRRIALDLGDRIVELIHPGRGHTAGDLVVRVPDADVMVGGDLVEESDKPFIGDDSFPLEWPLTLDLVLGLMTAVDRRGPRPRPAHRQGLRPGAARSSSGSSPRPSATSRAAACPSPRRSSRASGPGTRRCSPPPYGSATSTCRAARSGCRSSESLGVCTRARVA